MIRRRPIQTTDVEAQQFQRLTPYDNRQQPDIAQFADMRARLRHNVHRHGHPDDKKDGGIHFRRIHFTSRITRLATANVPVVVLPNNHNRARFMVVNTTGHIVYLTFNIIAISPADGIFGIPVPDGTRYDSGNLVTTDDVYCLSPIAPTAILAFEGMLS